MVGKIFIGICLISFALATYPETRNNRRGQIGGQNSYGAASEDETPKPYEFSYEAQDAEGNTHARSESGNDQGAVTGSYQYALANGVYRTVKYIADDNGFRAVIQTNEPGTDNKNPADVEITAEEPPAGVVPQNNGYGSQRQSQSGYGTQQTSTQGGYGTRQRSSQSGYGNQQRSSQSGYGSNGNSNAFSGYGSTQQSGGQAHTGSLSAVGKAAPTFSQGGYGSSNSHSASGRSNGGFASASSGRGYSNNGGTHKAGRPVMMAPYGQL